MTHDYLALAERRPSPYLESDQECSRWMYEADDALREAHAEIRKLNERISDVVSSRDGPTSVGWVEWKLTPVDVLYALKVPKAILDPASGRRAGIQYAPTYERVDNGASDQCPLCTLKGIHAHGLEDLRTLEKMVVYLKSKLGIADDAASSAEVERLKAQNAMMQASRSAKVERLTALLAEARYHVVLNDPSLELLARIDAELGEKK